MASIPSNGYAEVMAGSNNYSGSNSYDGSCPRTAIPPVIGDDLTNKTYVDAATGGGLVGLLTDKGSLITADGTQAVIFDQNPYQTALTTTTVYDWNSLLVGQTRNFTTTAPTTIPLGAGITITYSGTDSIKGNITAVAGTTITITITALTSAAYASGFLLQTVLPSFALIPLVSPYNLVIDPSITTPIPPNIPANTIITDGVCYVFNSGSGGDFFITLSGTNVVRGSSQTSPLPPSVITNSTALSFSGANGGCFVGSTQVVSITVNATQPSLPGLVIANTPPEFIGSLSGYTLAYSTGSIVIDDDICLIADALSSTGLAWGVINAAAVGAVTSVSGGVNIVMSGTVPAPVVNLRDPLTSQLNMGSQSLRDSASAVGTSGQLLSAGTGGQTLWTNPPPTNPTITDTNTNATYYPTFVAGSGTQPLLADISTGPISLNPSNGDFNVVNTMKLTQSQLSVGLNAGLTSQGDFAVAVGTSAGLTSQGEGSVAVGLLAGSSSQGNSSVAIGQVAGQTSQGAGSVAVGINAGTTSQGNGSVAVGNATGNNTQGASAVALGNSAGTTSQGTKSVAIGELAGNATQGSNSVALGYLTGQTSQGANATALGHNAGNNTQGNQAVAVGHNAGQDNQGTNAIAIGRNAGQSSQPANSIVLNASGVALNPATASAFYVNPVRNLPANSTYNLQYNPTTFEVSSFLNNNNVMMEDFDMYDTTTNFFGNRLSFTESGSGATTYYSGVYEATILAGAQYRRGILQMATAGSSTSTLLITDLMFSYANISKVTFGIVPHSNETLATTPVAAGNLTQHFGISSATSTTGVQASNTVIWRLTSSSATIPAWQFVINNVVQYTLTITPTNMTAKWCRAEINVNYGGGATATVSSTWYNLTDGTSETTGTYTITAGTGFPAALTTPNTVGIVFGNLTVNATNKYMGVDYVEVQQPNLYPVGSGTTATTGR